MRSKNPISLLVLFLCCLFSTSSAQESTRVKLIQADDWKYNKKLNPDIQRLIGNVILKHDSTYLHCDSAHLNEISNSFDGFGNVYIKVSDTLDIYGNTLNYDGNTKIAVLHNDVKLVDKRATLYTDKLIYNRNTRIAYYHTGGKIVDKDNELTSKIGYYFTNRKEAFFKDSVVLVNPQYTMNSDTLMYNTVSKVSNFFGPSTIKTEENFIYCENGWYDTQTDKSQFNKNAYMVNENQTLSGDSLFYDRINEYGEAFKNVSLIDTAQDIVIKGNYGEFYKKNGYAYVTDSALTIMIDKADSLFMHADTIRLTFDSTQQAEYLFAYYKTKFYRKDMQGMCDSLVYNLNDTVIYLYNNPVLWSEENQMTSDSISMILTNNSIDSIIFYNSAFIISKDDTSTYNQVKGRIMTGFFTDNEITKITVTGNSESLYYIREEDKSLVGINKMTSSNMLIFLDNNEIQTISYLVSPKGGTYPEHELTEEDVILRDFKWYIDKRPMKKEDIFFW